MSIILFLIYVLFLVFENLLLPAISGPEIFFITPIFLLAIIINSSDFRRAIAQVIIFGLVGELFMGAQLGSSLIPLVITSFVYFGLDRFIEMRAGLDSTASFTVILSRSFVLSCLVYIYSWFFILLGSSYGFEILGIGSLQSSWDTWSILLNIGTATTIFAWSCVFSLIFAYVLKTK